MVTVIIYFLSVSAPYSFHICVQQYLFSSLFSGFLYLFSLPHRKMKTNVALVRFMCFRSVLIHDAHKISDMVSKLAGVSGIGRSPRRHGRGPLRPRSRERLVRFFY
jgi:hypothetical protein